VFDDPVEAIYADDDVPDDQRYFIGLNVDSEKRDRLTQTVAAQCRSSGVRSPTKAS
jgi:hypothetical protein